MEYFAKAYDVAVIGAGHAGIEAGLAAARLGCSTAVFTINMDWVGNMPCNPSIGGTAKGHLVREVDALGGEMGRAADATALQFKMLNTTKGPGVQSLRVQSDKIAYRKYMQDVLLHQEHLQVREQCVERVIASDGKVKGVQLQDGHVEMCRALIITSGTFMSSTGPSRSVRGTGGRTDHGCALAEPARSGDPYLPLEDRYAGSGEERFDRFHEDCGAAWHR